MCSVYWVPLSNQEKTNFLFLLYMNNKVLCFWPRSTMSSAGIYAPWRLTCKLISRIKIKPDSSWHHHLRVKRISTSRFLNHHCALSSAPSTTCWFIFFPFCMFGFVFCQCYPRQISISFFGYLIPEETHVDLCSPWHLAFFWVLCLHSTLPFCSLLVSSKHLVFSEVPSTTSS